jgi:hypothetical protein
VRIVTSAPTRIVIHSEDTGVTVEADDWPLKPPQPRIRAIRDGVEFALLADKTGRVTHVSG